MKIIETEVLFRPETAELRFLPEGPYYLGNDLLSWVGIQHGPNARSGSVNVLNLVTGKNETHDLWGRPGFAFPTIRPHVFVFGLEREIGLFDTTARQWTPLATGIESGVTNTIINDGVVFEDNLIFGCKELEFKTKKAGLYLWRGRDQRLIQLRNDQICSNGKAVIRSADGSLTLFDIDSVCKTITRCRLDIENGTVGDPQIVVDLTNEDLFPDGLILTPDHQSLIVALYDPGDPRFGSARQYRISDGALEAIWTCAGSPRVTCPQLVPHNGRIRLVLTTAVEHMPQEQQERHPAAGYLFIGDTPFDSLGDQPKLTI